MNPIERFRSKYEVAENGCWVWTAHLLPDGYGVFWFNTKDRRAHRFSYEYHVGPIPDGLELDHLCRNPSCVNPAHLEPVTHAENTSRRGAAQTHCKYGHEYTPENTYVRREGTRNCRVCHLVRGRAAYARKKAAK